MKVALVERKLFGGTCVNTGCIPTKTLSQAPMRSPCPAERRVWGRDRESDQNRHERVKARADTVSTNARTNVEKWLRGMRDLTVIEGHARFEARMSSGWARAC